MDALHVAPEQRCVCGSLPRGCVSDENPFEIFLLAVTYYLLCCVLRVAVEEAGHTHQRTKHVVERITAELKVIESWSAA